MKSGLDAMPLFLLDDLLKDFSVLFFQTYYTMLHGELDKSQL